MRRCVCQLHKGTSRAGWKQTASSFQLLAIPVSHALLVFAESDEEDDERLHKQKLRLLRHLAQASTPRPNPVKCPLCFFEMNDFSELSEHMKVNRIFFIFLVLRAPEEAVKSSSHILLKKHSSLTKSPSHQTTYWPVHQLYPWRAISFLDIQPFHVTLNAGPQIYEMNHNFGTIWVAGTQEEVACPITDSKIKKKKTTKCGFWRIYNP